jgi:hypothetical protein
MNEISQYIISVVAVCIGCGLLRRLLDNKSASPSIVHTLCGVILTITIISPVLKINISSLERYISNIYVDAETIAQSSEEYSTNALRSIISDNISAYVLEKADLYDCQINQVEVVLSDDQIPTPVALRVAGRFSPYIRIKLSEIIESNLGIPKEHQQWIYQN